MSDFIGFFYCIEVWRILAIDSGKLKLFYVKNGIAIKPMLIFRIAEKFNTLTVSVIGCFIINHCFHRK